MGIAVVLLHFRPLPEPLRAKPALELLSPLVLVVVVANQTVSHCTSVVTLFARVWFGFFVNGSDVLL